LAHYGNPNAIRHYAGLDEDDVPDSELDFYIDQADSVVFTDVAIQVIDEVIDGSPNGARGTLGTDNRYIADTNYDCAVNSNDVTVYAWGKAGSLETREEWGVSSINPNEGKIYLSSIPSATFDEITIDYYYYKHKPVWSLLRRAANLWAAYDYIFAEYLLIPQTVRRGAFQFRHTKPYRDLKLKYDEAINLFNKVPFAKKKHDDITMPEKYMDEY